MRSLVFYLIIHGKSVGCVAQVNTSQCARTTCVGVFRASPAYKQGVVGKSGATTPRHTMPGSCGVLNMGVVVMLIVAW